MKTHPYLNTEDVTTSFLNERPVFALFFTWGGSLQLLILDMLESGIVFLGVQKQFGHSSDITRGFSNQEQYQNNMNMVNLSESDITHPIRSKKFMNHCQSGFSIDPE